MMNETDSKQISTGTRLGSMLLDHLFMTMIAMVFCIPAMVSIFANAFNVSHEQTDMNFSDSPWWYVSMLGFALYFCKDCVNGQSFAKRILKLQVVDNKTGEVASPMKCFIRNLFIPFWPIEAIVALTNPSRRLGDRVAGTKLVVFDPALEQPKINISRVIIPLVIAYGLVFLPSVLVKGLMASMEGKKINYIESSYNDPSSKEIEKLFADSLGQYLTASVRIYDQIQDKPLKYVSVIFELKEDYLGSDQDFEDIKSATLPLLFAQYPEESIVGQAKYIYQTSGHMQAKSLPLNWENQK